jgi:hypothetical protein
LAASTADKPLTVDRSRLKALQDGYRDANNMAAFIQAASNEPSHGGVFYAGIAQNDCMIVGSPVQTRPMADLDTMDPVDRAAATRARSKVAALLARCADVEAQFGGFESYVRALHRNKDRDPLHTIMEAARTNPITAYQDALRMADANLLAAVITTNPIDILNHSRPGSVTNQNADVIHLASMAVACEHLDRCWWRDNRLVHCVFWVSCGAFTDDDVAQLFFGMQALKQYEHAKAMLRPLFQR